IWDTCCVCISAFGITSDQLPCECPTEDCSYQYCVKRRSMKKSKIPKTWESTGSGFDPLEISAFVYHI
ncbi:unnamed protein product, partial [Rotaria socialis]